MTRLLFAAARGARIQGKDLLKGWVNVRYVSLPTPELYRIHPDDLNLQYGPISTALRENADGFGVYLWDLMTGEAADSYRSDDELYMGWNNEHHRFFYLSILAEALADEGL